MKPLSFILFNLWFLLGVSQTIQADQKIISNNGATLNNSNGTQVTYSVGESIIFKGSANSKIYTQGFQQPNRGLTFSFELISVSCMGATDGAIIITEINGCDPPYTLVVNGEVQSSLNKHGLSAGNYLIEISSPNCTNGQEINLIEPDIACELQFFNGFSPNNDHTNDHWIIQNINISPYDSNSIEIFDRWGGVVWKGENYDNSTVVFSGLDKNGNELPDGTYYYFAKVDLKEYSGHITLLR